MRALATCLLALSLLSGCLFSAENLTFDPDKGYLHSNKMEVKTWPEDIGEATPTVDEKSVTVQNRKPITTDSQN